MGLVLENQRLISKQGTCRSEFWVDGYFDGVIIWVGWLYAFFFVISVLHHFHFFYFCFPFPTFGIISIPVFLHSEPGLKIAVAGKLIEIDDFVSVLLICQSEKSAEKSRGVSPTRSAVTLVSGGLSLSLVGPYRYFWFNGYKHASGLHYLIWKLVYLIGSPSLNRWVHMIASVAIHIMPHCTQFHFPTGVTAIRKKNIALYFMVIHSQFHL